MPAAKKSAARELEPEVIEGEVVPDPAQKLTPPEGAELLRPRGSVPLTKMRTMLSRQMRFQSEQTGLIPLDVLRDEDPDVFQKWAKEHPQEMLQFNEASFNYLLDQAENLREFALDDAAWDEFLTVGGTDEDTADLQALVEYWVGWGKASTASQN